LIPFYEKDFDDA
jgi:hypothetical protein